MGSLYCVGKIRNGFGFRACLITPSIERSGRWYCKIHDPDRVRAKKAARAAEYDFLERVNNQNEQDMRRLADRLGCGHPHYRIGRTLKASGYWRELILNETEILALLARLSPDG